MNKNEHYQQGDVLLVKSDHIKGDRIESNVVQEGEHTGHAHRFTKGQVSIFKTSDDVKYVKVVGGTALLTHEEHLPVEIEEGEYEIKIVRQKDPFTKLISRVVD